MTTEIPEIPFFSNLYWEWPHEVASTLRDKGAVHRAIIPRGKNGIPVWVIVRHEEAQKALEDRRLSKDVDRLTAIINEHRSPGDTELSNMFSPHMIFSDPPRHTRLRNVLAKHFTQVRMKAMRPRIEELTNELLEDLPLGRPIDLIEQVAFPLPLNVICELIGVPERQRAILRPWTFLLMEDHPDKAKAASDRMRQYLVELIETTRADPGEDLLSALVQETEDRLSPDELLGTLFLLFVAGHETTTALIGNSIRWLMANPHRWRELGQRPELVPGAVKEIARFDSPVGTTTDRVTTEPVTYGETTIPADEIVLISLLSANRDPARYDRADQLDIHRHEPNLAFGYGIHYCLGAQLGRMEAEIALAALTQRFPDACLAVEEPQLRRRNAVIPNSYADLPVVLG